MTGDLGKLLDVLGRDADERMSICHVNGTGKFTTQICTVREAPAVAASYADGDCWYGVGLLHERVTGGRGLAIDVIGLRELYADLDVKVGGMASIDAARKVIAVLADMLGAEPVAIVSSGHGLQPHWAIERDESTDWADEHDPRHGAAVALVRRWGRLVAHVAELHGGSVDSVYDLSRVLRVPGGFNRKIPGLPVPVTIELTGGAPVSLDRLRDVLAEYGIPELPGDVEALGGEISAPADWTFGDVTCPYVRAMTSSWATDSPNKRHPWLMSQSVRLACAHRAGCITAHDHQRARHDLIERFRVLLLQLAPVRDERRGEVADAQVWGIAKTATFTDQRVRKELGDHPRHDDLADQLANSATRERLPILDWHVLWAEEDAEEWIVEPILPARRLVAVYSVPKVGKSLLMLEIAVAVSRGTIVLGVVPDRARRVLYVDFENDPRGDVRTRLQDMGMTPDDLAGLAYLSFPALAGLDSAEGGAQLLAAIAEYDVEVVVIDTVSRSVDGAENDNDTWLNFYRHTGVALKRAGVALMRLDHSGKDETKGQRGGSAKAGDVDAVWRLSKVSDTVFRLDCEATRMQIAEKTLVLHREADPLRHRVDPLGGVAAWDAKVAAVVAALVATGLPRSTGRDGARAALQASGIKASNAVLTEALRRWKASS